MNQNIRIAKELVILAKYLIADKQSGNQNRRRARSQYDIAYREIGFLDNPWRDIFYRWFDGLGDWENAPFGEYLMKNESLQRRLRRRLDKQVESFIKSNDDNTKIETSFHMELIDNGYFTGYQLLHGTTKYKGVTDHQQDFELILELKKEIVNGEVIITGKAHCVWHDIIDANKNYLGEHGLATIIKLLSKAKDYKISIPFDFEFKWKEKKHGRFDKKGYPWNNQTK